MSASKTSQGGLAFTCRYGGQTAHGYYSVAEHSVLVSRHVPPEFAREALLHDAAEAYVGDLVRPIKHQPELFAFRDVEDRVFECVRSRFGLASQESEAWFQVKRIDDAILVDEIATVMHSPIAGIPLGAEILCYGPALAEVLFLTRFYELFPEHLGSA